VTDGGRGPTVALLDYEMSNLRSVGKALERLGARVRVAARADDVMGADAIVLPGVGRFGAAMDRLAKHGFVELLRGAARDNVPVLGICLGLQLLFEESEESPDRTGLCLLPGAVRRLDTALKVPHIGWSEVAWRDGALLAPPDGGASARTYYFVHSYACVPADPDDVLATADHGTRFVAAAGRGSVMGVQFHPEKSSAAGLGLLGLWLGAVADRTAVAA
jgi:glutamine amidotransferase